MRKRAVSSELSPCDSPPLRKRRIACRAETGLEQVASSREVFARWPMHWLCSGLGVTGVGGWSCELVD